MFVNTKESTPKLPLTGALCVLNMSISESVSNIAAQLKSQMENLTTHQEQMLAVLIKMPKYLLDQRLDLWESAYQEAMNEEEESTENFCTIDEVFELGSLNLYGDFEANLTQKYYQAMLKSLKSKGYVIKNESGVEEW